MSQKNRIKETLTIVALFSGMSAFTGCGSSPRRNDDTKSSAAAQAARKNESESAPTSDNEKTQLRKVFGTDRLDDEAAKILASKPKDLFTLNALGFDAYRRRQFPLARYFWAKASADHPDSSALWNNLGVLYLAEGEKIAAFNAFKQAVRLDENNGAANSNLGTLYAEGEDWPRAISFLEAAFRKGIDSPSLYLNYGLALRFVGRSNEAKKILDDGAKKHNKDVLLILAQAALYIEDLNLKKEGMQLVYRVKFLETERRDVIEKANELERLASVAQPSENG